MSRSLWPRRYRPREYLTEDGPWDPITGGASALLGTIGSLMMGVADFPVEIIRALKPRSSDASSADIETSPSPASRSSTSLRSGADATDSPTTSDASSSATAKVLGRGASVPDGENSDPFPDGIPSVSPSSTFGSTKSSMAQALSGRLSRSNSGSRRSSSLHRRSGSDSTPQAAQVTLDAAIGATKSVSRIVGTGLKSPIDFTLSLARGFHNAPKLYGDTVRPSDKVTGIQSGLKAAGKEFGYGFYDGISGLVTQPIKGAKDEGPAGLVKGIGKGIGGLVLKPSAAIWGLPGYAFQGVAKEIQKHFGSSTQSYILAARTAQGYEDWNSSSEPERLDIINRWHHAQAEPKKSTTKCAKIDEHMRKAEEKIGEWKKSRKVSEDDLPSDRKKSAELKHKSSKKSSKHDYRDQLDGVPSDARRAQTPPIIGNREGEDAQFEQAINASVVATSRGDPEEDRLIARALRASVAELQSARGLQLSEDVAIERAIQASISEASRDADGKSPPAYQVPMSGRLIDKGVLEESLQRSLREYSFTPGHATARERDSPLDSYGSGAVEVTEESKGQGAADIQEYRGDPELREEQDLRIAIKESERTYKQYEEERARVLIEEQIVLRCVEQQSLQEEEHNNQTSKPKEGKDEK
ncbi:hypothetical protein GP486_003640 [Trichoglossum hirsutum]|uniref:Uncharacterized protein n=1 Tax=Trichoglossum hirsutum TaxID=265104 RepID=A0A9P8RQE2_9PEZI|nr:hypothetical protein GP486_003640 [Trichoglossum hirsutum]